MQSDRSYVLSALVFIGSLMAMLYAIMYVQQLSVAFGTDLGIYAAGRAYNITLTAADAGLVNNLGTLGLPMQLSYLMFALSVMLFAFATLQLFQNRKGASNIALVVSSLLFMTIVYMLETSFSFTEPYVYFAVAAAGSALTALPPLYTMVAASLTVKKRGMVRNIGLNPLTPYTNMQKLSRELTSRLNGSLKILDMHFDSAGLRNLAVLLDGNESNYTSIGVLAKGERLDAKFAKECRDFRDELSNKGVAFEIRVMSGDDSAMQHERLIMDDSHAYKIPPLNIINRKSEHVVRVGRAEAARRFDQIWSRSTKLENL